MIGAHVAAMLAHRVVHFTSGVASKFRTRDSKVVAVGYTGVALRLTVHSIHHTARNQYLQVTGSVVCTVLGRCVSGWGGCSSDGWERNDEGGLTLGAAGSAVGGAQAAFRRVAVIGEPYKGASVVPRSTSAVVVSTAVDSLVDSALLSIGVPEHVVHTSKAVLATVRPDSCLRCAGRLATDSSKAVRVVDAWWCDVTGPPPPFAACASHAAAVRRHQARSSVVDTHCAATHRHRQLHCVVDDKGMGGVDCGKGEGDAAHTLSVRRVGFLSETRASRCRSRLVSHCTRRHSARPTPQ